MVVFTCGHCGESVQKPKVEKHYLTKCRNKNPNLSCMDCFTDFVGKDYDGHIKCITEEERYSGKGFNAKEKKGEKKQGMWIEMLQDVLEEQKGASSEVLRILETISKLNNTPKKKPKFINFVKNTCGNKINAKDVDQVWDIISVKLSALTNSNVLNKNTNANEKTESAVNDAAEIGENGVTSSDKLEENCKNGEVDKKDDVNKSVQNGVDNKLEQKLSKKQRKEEKKRKKYEAELQSAEAPFEQTQKELEVPKKGKKNKNKGDNVPQVQTNGQDDKDKNKKRKRQDTVTITELQDNGVVNGENVPVKEKATKKKLRKDSKVEPDESVCLHDQNVAKSENEVAENNGKFNWHEVIISLLQKKGNELPFKRLQKKVLGEYSEYTGSEVDDRIADKFIKKLKSAPNVRVDKNRVLLLVDE